MSRMIDADALEKEGWSLHRTVRVDWHTLEYQTKPIAKVPTIEPEYEELDVVLPERTGKWIPCSERLPDHYEELLITRKCRVRNCEEYNVIDIGVWDDGWCEAWCEASEVVAWMPLPEPYKEEQS